MGRWAPLVNVSLFLRPYHFWSPCRSSARTSASALTIYAVRWKENIYIGMVVHCTTNTLSVIVVAALVLGRAEPTKRSRVGSSRLSSHAAPQPIRQPPQASSATGRAAGAALQGASMICGSP